MTFEERFRGYNFYHCIEVAPGIFTPGWQRVLGVQAPVLAEIRQRDLTGKTVLDIGCRDGLFSFAAEQQGGRVLGIDNNISPAALEFLIPHFGSKIEMREVNLYDFVEDERFDFVIFAGVLYHLRFPFLGLKRIADAMKIGGTLLIETGAMLSYHEVALLHAPAPKDSPYEPTSVTFFNLKGLTDALASFGFINVACVSVLPHHVEGEAFPSMDAYLASPAATAAPDLAFGRIVCTCEYHPSDNRRPIEGYWYGLHRMHTEENL